MRLGWDEIGRRARGFSEDWADATDERRDTQSFYNDFFAVFGIKRRQVAIYEQRVKLLDNRHGFIDLLWPRTLLIEQKSSRLDLRKAQGQALNYVEGIAASEQPRRVQTCDFQNWTLLDLETGDEIKFRLADLHKHVDRFDFMLGRRVTLFTAMRSRPTGLRCCRPRSAATSWATRRSWVPSSRARRSARRCGASPRSAAAAARSIMSRRGF